VRLFTRQGRSRDDLCRDYPLDLAPIIARETVAALAGHVTVSPTGAADSSATASVSRTRPVRTMTSGPALHSTTAAPRRRLPAWHAPVVIGLPPVVAAGEAQSRAYSAAMQADHAGLEGIMDALLARVRRGEEAHIPGMLVQSLIEVDPSSPVRS
jgi:hypothetical protein